MLCKEDFTSPDHMFGLVSVQTDGFDAFAQAFLTQFEYALGGAIAREKFTGAGIEATIGALGEKNTRNRQSKMPAALTSSLGGWFGAVKTSNHFPLCSVIL